MKIKLVSKDQTLDNELGIEIDNKFYSNNVNNDSKDFFEWIVREEENDIVITIVGESFESWEYEDESDYDFDSYVEENNGSFLESICYKKEEDFFDPISIRYYLRKTDFDIQK
jgi:hypothetical protein